MIARSLISAVIIAGLALVRAAPAAATDETEPIVVRDAHFGEVLFYFYQEDYFPAIVRLLAAQRRSQLDNHRSDADLLLGGMYLSYGHHREAARIFERLLADNVRPETRDRTWFFLAKIWHQRGYLAESQNALNNIREALPTFLEAERQMLQAQLYIDRGQYDQAIDVLSGWPEDDAYANYAKFNLGVAMVRSGRVGEAAALLNELGAVVPYGEEMRSLRDKANLALGYAYLQHGRPQAARVSLNRVRLEGPFSNKALLGIGWADAEVENYRRALVPWMELRNRDLLDSAVQESMLAIPYAMAKLDSISQAAEFYLNAIDAFDEETKRIDAAIATIEDGILLNELLAQHPDETTGWYWKLQALPVRTESRYLYHLLSTHRFQEGLKNYRDLYYLQRNLDQWQQSVDVFGHMLATRELAYRERLPKVENSLAQADIDGLVARKLDFDARLRNIEESRDALALATEHEFALWSEIIAIENNPLLKADVPEAGEVRDKIRLLKGTLQWTLEKEFKERLWRIRRDVRQTGEALVETQRARRQIDSTMRDEPLLFDDFESRVEGLGPRVDSLEVRVADAMERQHEFMRGVAVDELQAQKRRLDTYTVQARFALAAIYDLAASESLVGDAAQ